MRSRSSRSLGERVFALLLRCYPPRFRNRFAGEMMTFFREHRRERRFAGLGGAVRFWVHTVADVGKTAVTEWVAAPQGPVAHRANRPRAARAAGLTQDLRYVVRTSLRRPRVPIAVTLTLALGIGAATVMFSVVNAVVLKPLPYPDPDRLVVLAGHSRVDDQVIGAVNLEDLRDWEAQSGVFAAASAYTASTRTLTGDLDPQRVRVGEVSAGFFRVLGQAPALGTVFPSTAYDHGSARALALTHAFWRQRFGANRGVIGQSLWLDDVPYEITGVMPPTTNQLPSNDWDVIIPLVIEPGSWQEGRGPTWLSALGRLAPGASLERAQTALDLVVDGIGARFPEQAWRGVVVRSLKDSMIGPAKQMLKLLVLVLVFMLLIGCSSVANLLLVRASDRRHEFAVRAALGAGRGGLARLLLTESLLLTSIGAGVGVALANVALDSLLGVTGGSIPRATEIAIDGAVVGFVMVMAVLVALLLGLLSARLATHTSLAAAMQRSGSRTSAGPGAPRLRAALVSAQIAFSVVLVFGAALLLQSLWRLSQRNPGFDPSQLITFSVALPDARYGDPVRQQRFYDDLFSRFSQLPGVQIVSAADVLPPAGSAWFDSFTIDAVRPPVQGEDPSVEVRRVAPGFFEALRIPVLSGRPFDRADRASGARVAIVNQRVVNQYFGGLPPLGRTIGFFGEPYIIVGVVGDVLQKGLEAEPAPALYFPQAQLPFGSGSVLVRVAGDPGAAVPMLRRGLAAVDPQIPMGSVLTMQGRLSRSLGEPRFRAILLASFGSIALVLALLGIYSIVSYAVAERSREIGIRLALGSARTDVWWLVVRQSLVLTLLAVAVGQVGALSLAGLLRSFLFGVEARDPATLAAVAALLVLVAFVASALPARRAARLDPLAALRSD